MVAGGKNVPLTVVLRMPTCHIAGSAKWCWPQNCTGTIKWEVNQPNLQQPLEELWLRITGLQMKAGHPHLPSGNRTE